MSQENSIEVRRGAFAGGIKWCAHWWVSLFKYCQRGQFETDRTRAGHFIRGELRARESQSAKQTGRTRAFSQNKVGLSRRMPWSSGENHGSSSYVISDGAI